jgi:hypothetical protein
MVLDQRLTSVIKKISSLLAAILALTAARAQYVVTSTATEIAGATFVAPNGDGHFRDYIVSYGFGGSPAPSFTANLSDFDEFVYRVLAPEGQMFSVEVPESGAPQSGWIVMSLDWGAPASAVEQVDMAGVSLVFHDYAGPGFGTVSLPLKISPDGSGISMGNGAQQLLAGIHTFSGFSLTGGYSAVDTTGWGAETYTHGQFWVNYYIATPGSSSPIERLKLVSTSEAAAVPEPASIAVIAGLVALALVSFRRSQ